MIARLNMGILQNPVALLLVTGTLFGFNFPLGKIAGDAGVSPLVWAMTLSLGVTFILLPVLLASRKFVFPKGRMIRYVILSALISFITPNILLFSVIPHAGAGYTGLMFALSPVFTLALAVAFRLKTPNKLGVIGIGIGLLGAITVSVSRGASPEAPELVWILAALMIPMVLAVGNIYRTMDWPDNAEADTLAFWGHSFALPVFGVLLVATDSSAAMGTLLDVPATALAQMLVAGIMFPVFFRLQKQGGPVLLSQIGYVAAAVGLLIATLALGETYGTVTWIGAAIIGLGIAVTIRAQQA